MAPKKNKAVAAASTKKAIKATQSTATNEIIKRYKTAKNIFSSKPIVVKALAIILSFMFMFLSKRRTILSPSV